MVRLCRGGWALSHIFCWRFCWCLSGALHLLLFALLLWRIINYIQVYFWPFGSDGLSRLVLALILWIALRRVHPFILEHLPWHFKQTVQLFNSEFATRVYLSELFLHFIIDNHDNVQVALLSDLYLLPDQVASSPVLGDALISLHQLLQSLLLFRSCCTFLRLFKIRISDHLNYKCICF